MRRFLMALTAAVLVALGLLACGGEQSEVPSGTPTLIASPTPTVATAPVTPTASRQEVYAALDNLSIGLLPLDRQGRDDWWSTRLPNADITIDIFGPEDRVEAVELWYRRSVPTSTAASVVEALAATIIPGQQVQSTSWFRNSLNSMEPTVEQKQQTYVEGLYLTLQYVPKLNQYFFSIDSEKQ